jgi:hypothetical protein
MPPGGLPLIARTARKFPLIIALVVVLVAVPAAFAGKGGGGGGKPGGGGGGTTTGGSGTITGPVMVVDANTNGSPNWGDTVRFVISTTASSPYVDLKCYQGGAFVGEWTQGYFAGALDTGNFVLKAPMWLSGAANCTATLQVYGRSWTQLASMSFPVGA